MNWKKSPSNLEIWQIQKERLSWKAAWSIIIEVNVNYESKKSGCMLMCIHSFSNSIGNCVSIEPKPSGGCTLRRKRKMSQATAGGARVPRAELFVLATSQSPSRLERLAILLGVSFVQDYVMTWNWKCKNRVNKFYDPIWLQNENMIIKSMNNLIEYDYRMGNAKWSQRISWSNMTAEWISNSEVNEFPLKYDYRWKKHQWSQ